MNLKRHKKLCLLHFHVISPNATKYTTKLDKKIPQNKKEIVVCIREKVRDHLQG